MENYDENPPMCIIGATHTPIARLQRGRSSAAEKQKFVEF